MLKYAAQLDIFVSCVQGARSDCKEEPGNVLRKLGTLADSQGMCRSNCDSQSNIPVFRDIRSVSGGKGGVLGSWAC